MKYSNDMVAARFIHSAEPETSAEFFVESHGGAFWARGNAIYSYGTRIGELIRSVSGEKILLMSVDNFSSTTSKHLNHLLVSTVSRHIKHIYVPFEYGERGTVAPIGMAWRYLTRLQELKERKLTLKKNRVAYISMFYNAKNFSKEVYPFNLQEEEEFCKLLQDPEYVKELKKQARQSK